MLGLCTPLKPGLDLSRESYALHCDHMFSALSSSYGKLSFPFFSAMRCKIIFDISIPLAELKTNYSQLAAECTILLKCISAHTYTVMQASY